MGFAPKQWPRSCLLLGICARSSTSLNLGSRFPASSAMSLEDKVQETPGTMRGPVVIASSCCSAVTVRDCGSSPRKSYPLSPTVLTTSLPPPSLP